ncbi:MAG: aminotransferase class IV [bacterium]
MSLLFETIKIVNRQPQNLSYHNERMNKARRDLFGICEAVDLENIISVPSDLFGGVYKCRVVFNTEIREVNFEKYEPRKINGLKLVECNEINYDYKYTDRSKFEILKRECNCRSDEDIVVVKNGLMTDTSFSNIVFKKHDKWLTPSKPLLEGTQRAKLLKEGAIFPAVIHITELNNFEEIGLINAMINLEDRIKLTINSISR